MKRNLLYIVVTLLGMVSCRPKENVPAGAVVLSHGGKDASCPYITKDAKGRTVISWVEKDSTADTGVMLYAVSNDNGHTFSSPMEIAATKGVYPHAENLPKLLFRPDGSVIALFGVEQHDPRNKYAGKVMYAISVDSGRVWGAPQSLVTDTAGYDQRYFDMALLPGGQAAAIWLDNRKDTKAEGSTLYWAVTADQGGFQAAKPIAQTVCQCCRTRLYVAGNGDIHVAYRDIINDSIRDMVHQVSVDGGQSFSEPVRISADNWVVNGCPHTGPALTANRYGLHFAWFTMGNGQGIFYTASIDNGKTYTQKESLSKAPMAKHPQIVTIPGDRVVIVWDEPVKWQGDFRSRIGIAVKSPEGQTMTSRTLTADSIKATYPVAGALDSKTLLVAYTRQGEVVYERVAI
ncbi:sialidase family protein [Chitinophaga qingshengii]|uniref:Exo-alpha-sialidase n=1 Tax=Chitinophaga qingshengii TaxID=1569794 RepID=A0ABR7TMK8_9BACT|nr:sialidase family protein [Chitinophaga qingshengii]MBC9930746.1 exo-alpha-sialidase [Chitinophaga qingshengii]